MQVPFTDADRRFLPPPGAGRARQVFLALLALGLLARLAAALFMGDRVEPLPGMYPLPGVGPFHLLGESKMNYWGKLMFRWVYFNLMLKGHDLPLEPQMYMAGKNDIRKK